MKTKKLGISARFGSKYGKSARDRFRDVQKIHKGVHVCPKCIKPGLKRKASGIWECGKCHYKMAGKAYKPS